MILALVRMRHLKSNNYHLIGVSEYLKSFRIIFFRFDVLIFFGLLIYVYSKFLSEIENYIFILATSLITEISL